MRTQRSLNRFFMAVLIGLFSVFFSTTTAAEKKKGAQEVPVQVVPVEKKMVSDQISLIGTTEPIAQSTVAAEVSGIVKFFPVREGRFVKKGDLLVRLKSTDLKLRLKRAKAGREKIRLNLQLAKKELARVGRLKDLNSISEKKYDEAFYRHRSLQQEVMELEAEIERLNYEIKQKKVVAPFSGFISEEHTQVGEWINPGGPVVTLVDLGRVRVTVDVPERYVIMLSLKREAKVIIRSISSRFLIGKIDALLPMGNPDARTFPVRINLPNPDLQIKGGMEAIVRFNLNRSRGALLLPKDAVVTAGNSKLVFSVKDGKAFPVTVKILGYYEGSVAIEGNLKAGDLVVIRGNERLQPGQQVKVVES